MKTLNFQTLFMAFAALLLIGLGTPRFLASIWMAVGDPIYQDIGSGTAVSEDDVRALIESRKTALSLVDLPRAATDLGTAYVQQETSPEAIERAIQSIKSGLEMAPVSAFAWLRLASLQATDPNQQSEAVAAWETARKLAEHEPFLLHARIQVGITLYGPMNDVQRELLRTDVETAYRQSRSSLYTFGKNNNLLEWFKFLLRDEEKTKFLNRQP